MLLVTCEEPSWIFDARSLLSPKFLKKIILIFGELEMVEIIII